MMQKHMMTTLPLLALFILGTPHLSGDAFQVQAQSQGKSQDATAVIGRSAQVYRALRSLRADFVQIVDNPMVGDSLTSRGVLIQAGARLAMRFSDPAGDAIVVDGKHAWLYTPSTTPGQVIRSPVPSGGAAYEPYGLAWLLDRPAERYNTRLLREESINGRTTDVLELIPNVPDLPFAHVVVWLDRGDGLPRRLEVKDKSGVTRKLTLSKIRKDERVSDKTFKLDLPANTRIVDQ